MKAGSIYYHEEQDKSIKEVTCPHCNSLVDVTLNRIVQNGRVFFVPFVKMNVKYYSTCPNCAVDLLYNKGAYNQIKNSTNPQHEWNEVSKACYEKSKKKSTERIKRSSKKIFIAALLSLIGCPLGLHNLYLGHKKRFLVNLSLFFLSVFMIILLVITKSSVFALPFALFLATNVYWGLFDFFRVLLGYAKDSEGGYLLTEKDYRRRLIIHGIMYE